MVQYFRKGREVIEGMQMMVDNGNIYDSMLIDKNEYYDLGSYRITKIFQFIWSLYTQYNIITIFNNHYDFYTSSGFMIEW